MPKEDNENFNNSTKCQICDGDYGDNDVSYEIIVISPEN